MSPLSASKAAAGLVRDITWDRPVFRPPALPNPRIMFDPLPFTTQRPSNVSRPHWGS